MLRGDLVWHDFIRQKRYFKFGSVQLVQVRRMQYLYLGSRQVPAVHMICVYVHTSTFRPSAYRNENLGTARSPRFRNHTHINNNTRTQDDSRFTGAAALHATCSYILVQLIILGSRCPPACFNRSSGVLRHPCRLILVLPSPAMYQLRRIPTLTSSTLRVLLQHRRTSCARRRH